MFVSALVPFKTVYSQQAVVDELLPQASNFEAKDTKRVDYLLQLAEGYLFVSPERSEEIGLEAKQLAEELSYPTGRIRANLLLGRSFLFRGDFINDISYLLAAANLAQVHSNIMLRAEAYRNIGEHYLFIGKHIQALENLQQALILAEQQDNRRLLGATYFSLGSFFLQVERFKEAEEYLLNALPIFEEVNEQRGVAVAYGSLGKIYRQQGKLEASSQYLQKNIDIFMQLGDYLSLAESYLIMSKLDQQKGDKDTALAHLNTANSYADFAKDLNQKTLILTEIGFIYFTQENYTSAEKYYVEAMELAQMLEIKENEMKIHENLVSLYKQTGEVSKSLQHLEDYGKLRDQLFPLNYGETIIEIQKQFEAERKESELNSLRRIQAENTLEMERERNRLNTAIVAIVFVLTLVGVLALRYKSKADAARQMAMHNRQLLVIGKELEHVNNVKSDFLANTSHEIRTPLNGILGMVTLLSQSSLSSTQQEQVKAIELSGKKLLDLVNDLLDLTKIEAGKIEINYTPMNIEETLAPEIAIWEEMTKADGLDFNVEMDDDLPYRLTGAAARIVQVLTNLVGNAVKFTENGFVTLRVFVEKDFGQEVLVRFEVEDSGMGIPASKLENLFERFSQIDSGLSRSFQGTGLGLAISRDLVRIMNGSIGVESEEGKGSKFWFRLPMHINKRNYPREVQDNLQTAFNQDVSSTSLNVLVAEDNVINQAVIKGMLDHLGHKISFANNGEEVVEKITEVKPDVILMDIQMPIMDGEQATSVIREMPGEIAKTPIVAITANAMAGDAEKFIEKGMDAYLPKPVNLDKLQNTLMDMKSIIEMRRN